MKGNRVEFLPRVILLFLFLFFPVFSFAQDIKLDSLINRFNLATDNKEKLELALEIMDETYYYDSTTLLKYADISLKLCDLENNNIKRGDTYLNLGYYYSERNRLMALEYAKKSLDSYCETDSIRHKSKAYTLFGTIYFYSGNYSKAFENYLISLKIDEQLHNEKNLAAEYNNLAMIFSLQKNNTKAIEYFFKSLELNKKFNLFNSYCNSLMNISISYGEIDSINLELRYGIMALDSARKFGNEDVLSRILLNLGNTYLKLQEFDKVEACFKEAEVIFMKTGSVYNQNFLLARKGDFYLTKEQPDLAVRYYKLALEEAQKNGYLQLVEDACKNLSSIYKSKNSFQESLYYYEIFHRTSDSLSNVEKSSRITELQLQYEFDKQLEMKRVEEESRNKVLLLQHRIIIFSATALILAICLVILILLMYRSKQRAYMLLTKRNEQIFNQNIAIKKQSEELKIQQEQLNLVSATKDKLYSIIAHDLKNPFNVMIGFTNLLVEKWSEIIDAKKIEYITQLYKTANSTHELLQNLLDWERSLSGKITVIPTPVDLKKYLDEDFDFLNEQAKQKNIQIVKKVNPSTRIFADINMLGAIIRNIVSNAIKFTNENGVIKIWDEKSADNYISIIVEDNGVGMTSEESENLFKGESQFTAIGTNNEKGTGLGLILCKEFVEKNNGRISVESRKGEGSKFILTFPEADIKNSA